MPTTNSRSYACKDEELTVISKYVSYSFRRDLSDFTAFSPKFTEAYAQVFDSRIDAAVNIIEPKTETAAMKLITEQLHSTMQNLAEPLNHLQAYLALAKNTLKMSVSDFGIAQIRKSINSLNIENTLKNIHILSTNIDKNKVELQAQGLTDELILSLQEAYSKISELRQSQYEAASQRKELVQQNISLFNTLYENLNEILTVGKLLYKTKSALKVKEYTFSELTKRAYNYSKGNEQPSAS